MDNLNKAIREFHDDIVESRNGIDPRLKGKLDVAIIKFDQEPALVHPNQNNKQLLLSKEVPMPELTSRGSTTQTVKAVNFALQLVEQVKREYYTPVGLTYKRPWIVIMTDGRSSSTPEDTLRLVQHLEGLKKGKKVNLLGIGIGDDADINHLSKITLGKAQMMPEDGFLKFFQWLSNSLSASIGKEDDYDYGVGQIDW